MYHTIIILYINIKYNKYHKYNYYIYFVKLLNGGLYYNHIIGKQTNT